MCGLIPRNDENSLRVATLEALILSEGFNGDYFPLKSAGRLSRKDTIASFKSSDMSRVAFF